VERDPNAAGEQAGELGVARREIEAQLPMPRDAACDPLEAMTAAKRFLFLDATTLELPRIARIARVPDLSIMATGGFPYAVGGKNRPRLAIPSLDPASIGAAATLATHLAIASGEPIDFEVSQALPRLGAGATLVVAPVRALDDDLLRAMNLQQGAAITAWRTKAPVAAPEDASLTRLETIARNRLVLQRNFPPACHMRRPPLGWARNPAGIDLTATGQIAIPLALDPLEEWNRQINGASWSRSVRAALSGAKLWIDHRVEALGSGLEARFTSEPTEVDIAQGASLVMAQAAFGGARDDIWTLVTAPTAARMAEAVACMVDPRVWRQIAGRVSALDETNAEIHSIEARDAHFLVTERLTIENVRLITAGWFSQNAIAYVAAALVLALLIGGSTLVMVRNIGRRN